MRGLVSISTKQEDILKALLYKSHVGYEGREATIDNVNLADPLVQAIRDRRLDHKYISFQDLFDGDEPAGSGGPVAQAFRNLGTSVFETANPGDTANDAVREAPFRNILDMITFRQNILTIVMAARLLGPDEDVTRPLAERRALATIYRDAYTGAFFVRSFKWLND
jgi:hypothetical protein